MMQHMVVHWDKDFLVIDLTMCLYLKPGLARKEECVHVENN